MYQNRLIKYDNVKATVVYNPTKCGNQNCLQFWGRLVSVFETEVDQKLTGGSFQRLRAS